MNIEHMKNEYILPKLQSDEHLIGFFVSTQQPSFARNYGAKYIFLAKEQ